MEAGGSRRRGVRGAEGWGLRRGLVATLEQGVSLVAEDGAVEYRRERERVDMWGGSCRRAGGEWGSQRLRTSSWRPGGLLNSRAGLGRIPEI